MVDEWFLAKLKKLHEIESRLRSGLNDELYRTAKRAGYPDRAIERISGQKVASPAKIGYKMVDTCAAEFEAQTPYFYASYDEENEAQEFIAKKGAGKKRRHRVRLRPDPDRPGHRV